MDQLLPSKALCEQLTLYVLGVLDTQETDQVEASLMEGDRRIAQELSAVSELVGLLGHRAPLATPAPALRRRLFDRLGLD